MKKSAKTGRVSGRAKNKANVPKESNEPKFWILWAPSSNKPPRIRFGTLEKVREVANIMVDKYHSDFYVMQSVEVHKLGKPTVVPFTGRPAKKPKEMKLRPQQEVFMTNVHQFAKSPAGKHGWYNSYEEWKAVGYTVRSGQKHSRRRQPNGVLVLPQPNHFSPGDGSVAVFHVSQVEPTGIRDERDPDHPSIFDRHDGRWL